MDRNIGYKMKQIFVTLWWWILHFIHKRVRSRKAIVNASNKITVWYRKTLQLWMKKVLKTRRSFSCHTCRRITSGGKSAVKDLKLERSSPNSISELFMRIDKMAWVAHALLMICFAKNTWSDASLWLSGCAMDGWAPCHLNKNIKP